MRLLCISALAAIYLFRLSQITQYQIPENQSVKIKGRITEQPYLKDSYQIIKVGPILAYTTRFPGYDYGDQVEIVGRFEAQPPALFQRQYFAYFPTIQKIEESGLLPARLGLNRFFLNTRGLIEKKLSSFLPEPEGSLLLGIVLGVKSQMPEDFRQKLRKTGTIHLVVASGQNVAILAGFLIETLVWLMRRQRAIWLTLVAIFSYALLTGGQPPVIRAGLMVGLAYAAQLFGREGEGLRLLLMAGTVMLLVSPLILFDIGFQLSFTATAGIILFYPALQPKFSRLPVLGGGLATTLAAQLATLPILLANFGTFSALAPLVNALVLPTIPFVMSLGLVLAALSLFITPVAQLLAWLVWPILRYFVAMIEIFGR